MCGAKGILPEETFLMRGRRAIVQEDQAHVTINGQCSFGSSSHGRRYGARRHCLIGSAKMQFQPQCRNKFVCFSVRGQEASAKRRVPRFPDSGLSDSLESDDITRCQTRSGRSTLTSLAASTTSRVVRRTLAPSASCRRRSSDRWTYFRLPPSYTY
jgi:hypothetical protein